MTKNETVSKINEYLYISTEKLAEWLEKKLPQVSEKWWDDCVIKNLSAAQRDMAGEKGYCRLGQFDLAALLRVADRSWYLLRSSMQLPGSMRECIKKMMEVRNVWAHCTAEIPDKNTVLDHLDTINGFLEYTEAFDASFTEINDFIGKIKNLPEDVWEKAAAKEAKDIPEDGGIFLAEKQTFPVNLPFKVRLKAMPEKIGMAVSVSGEGEAAKYGVFLDGDTRNFLKDQIEPIDDSEKPGFVTTDAFLSYLTALQINNPCGGNLYSLNSARIDFVPYQFRPALKIIKADEPRILIADSVGVGKTIEAGLIIKELEARGELNNIAVICPKPLVSERKWEYEMQRFDEDFIPLDGGMLRQILSDTARDGEWPGKYNRVIIPYSVLDGRTYNGDNRRSKIYGLTNLDPAPHFDLVIVDEAHHIRNGSMEKEKAFGYKCVRYFCEHSDAVVMLTATPLQTGDDNLYTLLNLLRPDIVIDKAQFGIMSYPNQYVSACSHILRGGAENWQTLALRELEKIRDTQWGRDVIMRNPLYQGTLKKLASPVPLTGEERVGLISDVESLHSFDMMFTRTRRKDIKDFCIRRPNTVMVQFTDRQKELHDELLRFEREVLLVKHDQRTIPFLISMMRRQAASCIFGLAPYIEDIAEKRISGLFDEADFDIDEPTISEEVTDGLKELADRIKELSRSLPQKDNKFDALLKIIREKDKQKNNKVIVFSTFRRTLEYIGRRLESEGIRTAQVNGDVCDADRLELRMRFEKGRSFKDALDVLLFTEVGSEGLDYQFCDTMVNYDLPWNPMRIEQRIGRIDRHGQKNDFVNVCNIITEGTVDDDIYTRCLKRIGIFERSIGDCDAILGEMGKEIEKINLSPYLSSEERREKLRQMTDNKMRRMHEMARLEDEEKAFFGLDLSMYTTAEEIRNAENPWISPYNLQKLVERYLNQKLGGSGYISGGGALKSIRLSSEARGILYEDFEKLPFSRIEANRRWKDYLKGRQQTHLLTFLSEEAQKDKTVFFITLQHPLVRQAAGLFSKNGVIRMNLKYYSDNLPAGEYPFIVYTWEYVGLIRQFKLVTITGSEAVENEIDDIFANAQAADSGRLPSDEEIKRLEDIHYSRFTKARKEHVVSTKRIAEYKEGSLRASFENRKSALERKIAGANDPNILRMAESELNKAENSYNEKIRKIGEECGKADIYHEERVRGILRIVRDKK